MIHGTLTGAGQRGAADRHRVPHARGATQPGYLIRNTYYGNMIIL